MLHCGFKQKKVNSILLDRETHQSFELKITSNTLVPGHNKIVEMTELEKRESAKHVAIREYLQSFRIGTVSKEECMKVVELLSQLVLLPDKDHSKTIRTGHFCHEFSPYYELFFLFNFPDAFEEIRQQLAVQMSDCVECISGCYSMRADFLRAYAKRISSTTMARIKSQAFKWDVNRQLKYINQLKKCI